MTVSPETPPSLPPNGGSPAWFLWLVGLGLVLFIMFNVLWGLLGSFMLVAGGADAAGLVLLPVVALAAPLVVGGGLAGLSWKMARPLAYGALWGMGLVYGCYLILIVLFFGTFRVY